MKAQHPLVQLCAAFEVKRSGYQAWAKAPASPRAQSDATLLPKIHALHQKHKRRCGAPRIREALARQGQHPGRKRIARLMKQEGLRGLCSRRFVPRTTQSGHDQPIAPNRLAQRPAPTGPDQVWVNDLTYVRRAQGWLHVAVILDLWSRCVVGWNTGPTLQSCLVERALRMALKHRQPPRGLLQHSDRGGPYASGDYRALLAAAGIDPSMSRAGKSV